MPEPAAPPVHLRDQPTGSGETCRQILATLPTWFGIAEANEDYVAAAERWPTIVATVGDDSDGNDVDGTDVGLLTVAHHRPYAAEIHLMAVRPEHHRQGIGRTMLRHLESSLAHAGVEFLQVKTLSPAHPDPGYAATRAFYLAQGFRPLEEFPDLWGPENPALQMIKSIRKPS
jgi:GNAT superfamily N-acetyltransferase